MAEKPIAYEPHPVSPERKAELVKAGYRIIDAIYAPPGEHVIDAEHEAPEGLTIGKGPGGRITGRG